MFCVLLRFVPQRDIAEDLLHDGFIHLFEKIKDFRGDGSFEGWSRRIFITMALSHLRRGKRWITTADDQCLASIPGSSVSAIEKMELEELTAKIAQLPHTQRTILNLYSIEGYSHDEIAAMLGITTQNSRTTLHRAKAQLSQIIATR